MLRKKHGMRLKSKQAADCWTLVSDTHLREAISKGKKRLFLTHSFSGFWNIPSHSLLCYVPEATYKHGGKSCRESRERTRCSP